VSIVTKAAVARSADGNFVVEKVTLDDLRDDEILVEVHACGICHMDIEAKKTMELPAILGHEGAGVVADIGRKVTSVKIGDRVVMGYGSCGNCIPCGHDQAYFCDRGWELTFGGGRLDGSATAIDAAGNSLRAAFFQQSSFARHAITLARSVVPISDSVPWHVAAAVPCGFLTGAGTAQNILAVGPDSSFLVRGVGAVGLGAVMAAKRAGCHNIVASDLRENRLQIARDFGATATVHAIETDFDDWRRKEFPRGFTHIFDTTGNAKVFQNSIENLATGGEMAYAILPAPMEEFSFKPFQLFVKCANLRSVSFGSASPRTLVPKMLQWWAEGDFPIESVIGTFDFDAIDQAADAGHSGTVVKPVLLMR
jgi:aryl-alcohol dehydrogenase